MSRRRRLQPAKVNEKQTPIARVADSENVTEPMLFKTYQTIREQIIDELLVSLVKAASSAKDEDIRAFVNVTQKTLFGPFYNTESEGLVGLGTNAARGQQLLGSVLAENGSKYWVAWFLAYPVDRKRPKSFVDFRVSLELEEPDLKRKVANITTFFDQEEEVKNVLTSANTFADLGRSVDERTKSIPENLRNGADAKKKLSAAIFIDFVARFVLLEAPYLPLLTREFKSLDREVSLDEYALTYFALGFGLGLASKLPKEPELLLAPRNFSEIDAKIESLEFGSEIYKKELHYAWTLFPYRVNVAMGHILFLISFVVRDQNLQKLTKSFFKSANLGNVSITPSPVALRRNLNAYIRKYEVGNKSVQDEIAALKNQVARI